MKSLPVAINDSQRTGLTPVERVEANAKMVKALAPVVREAYILKLQGRDYLTVAGCQIIASGLGYTTGTASLQYVPGVDGLAGSWRASVEVMDESGRVVGAGVSSVFDDERPWNTRPQFARQGMAQTRATGRALKGVMGYAFALLGVESAFAEEMPHEPSTMPQEASAPVRRLAAPPAAPAAPKANAAASVPAGGQRVTGVCAGVEKKVSKSGKAFYRIGLETAEGEEWFTSFDPVADCAGKSVALILKPYRDDMIVATMHEIEPIGRSAPDAEVPF